jgi:peptidoglycan/xylan/chitin deacetylase (PgdA/CDA1 family)
LYTVDCSAVRIPILCYHKIGDAGGRSLNVAEADFLRQVAFLRRRFSFRRLSEWPSPSREGGRRPIVLTFDDAYASTAEVLLRTTGLVGTVFPVPALVGRASEWDGESARPLASWEALAALRDTGFEMGNHTFSHADLPASDDGPLGEEIAGAAVALSERLGVAVRSFCYPYGRLDERAISVVSGAGYAAAVTTKTGVARSDGDPFRLPRLKISYSDRLAGLVYKLYVRPLLGV